MLNHKAFWNALDIALPPPCAWTSCLSSMASMGFGRHLDLDIWQFSNYGRVDMVLVSCIPLCSWNMGVAWLNLALAWMVAGLLVITGTATLVAPCLDFALPWIIYAQPWTTPCPDYLAPVVLLSFGHISRFYALTFLVLSGQRPCEQPLPNA